MSLSSLSSEPSAAYVGRLAPSPSGHLHVGHAQTFYSAMKRAEAHSNSNLVLRIEDLDAPRCKPEFLVSIMEDLNWFGIKWTQGPQLRDPEEGIEYLQSNRYHIYKEYWARLLKSGCIYPCKHSRKDVERALSAPHEGDAEIVFPTTLRPDYMQFSTGVFPGDKDSSDFVMSHDYYRSKRMNSRLPDSISNLVAPTKTNWRFRVPDGMVIKFNDNRKGWISYMAGVDFGDFLVWRADGFPSYDFACAVDDATMGITEVVRGEDLLVSTARQLLLLYALNIERIPEYYHCPLLRDETGKRLAKRDDARSIKSLREGGYTPERIMQEFFSDN